MFRMIRILVAIRLWTVAYPAVAHGAHGQQGEAPGWTFDLWVTVPLALVLLIFLVGRRRLTRRTKSERKRSWLFLAGWLVLTLSLVSPLHQGGERSFTLHMIEHELIMLVATYLLAASRAGGELAWGLPVLVRNVLGGKWKAPLAGIWRRLAEPMTATLLQAVTLWAWHAPALFDRALASQGWHVAQHLSFVISSLIFWSAMLDVRRSPYLLSAACLFITSLIEGALGALMSLASSPWYSAYAAMGVTGIDLDPTTDQQLAGLIMWIPGGLIHGGAALALLYQWLKVNEESRGLRTH